MHTIAILNRDGGTFRTMNMEMFTARMQQVFAAAGHRIDIHVVPGDGLIDALERAAHDNVHDTMIAGGGDGTISAAARIAFESGKPLGILPAGTMNLFARVLGLPLDLDEAVIALSEGHPGPADIATVNGKTFVHQVSAGFHPRFVRIRNAKPFGSRLGKIRASASALFHALMDPPRFPVEITMNGETHAQNLLSLSISNNPYGETPLPYAADASGGVLGVYTTRPLRPRALFRLAADVLFGSWRSNKDFEETLTTEVRVHFPKLPESARIVIDGELEPMPRDMEVKIHPGGLNVIHPSWRP